MPDAKSTAKGRKIGRNKKKCERYRAEGRREKNKKRRAVREFKREVKLVLLRARNRPKGVRES